MENETETEIETEILQEESVEQVDEIQTVIALDLREMTVINGESSEIHVIHEITLGEVMITTLLFAILIFMMLSRFVRRKLS